MKTIIHVNQHNIKHNRQHDDKKQVITIKNYKKNQYSNRVDILDKNGEIVATVKYSPDKPLSCGATVWIETQNQIVV